jgi:hypothetical protein
MLDLIRDGSAPASIMRRAALGELSLPASEAIEILVSLAADRELGAEAEQTLLNWEESSLVEVSSNPQAPTKILNYLLQHLMQRPAIVSALCDNSAVPLAELEPTAKHAGTEVLQAMMQSARVCGACRLLELIASNPASVAAGPNLGRLLFVAQENEARDATTRYLDQHAEAITREDAQLFEIVAGPEGEEDPLSDLLTRVRNGETAVQGEEIEQLSLLQRIGRMRVGERIKLALRGGREERMVLIRDRSKLVSLAVLDSPKVNDSEMESYAAMKNVQESVLRAIATKRNYIKNYGVLRTLVNNPKTPLDVALPLLSHLLIKDLRAMAINKNVNETVRKMAMRMFRVKTERKS